MLGTIVSALAVVASGLACRLVGGKACAGGPSACVLLFRDAVAEGRVEEIGNFFSFRSAYQYWQDVTASLGVGCPQRDAFADMLSEHFRDVRVRREAASFIPARMRCKVVGTVASVVFCRQGAPAGDDAGVASAVLESGLWTVRTFPGIFPGALLADVRRAAVQQARKDAVEHETQ